MIKVLPIHVESLQGTVYLNLVTKTYKRLPRTSEKKKKKELHLTVTNELYILSEGEIEVFSLMLLFHKLAKLLQ